MVHENLIPIVMFIMIGLTIMVYIYIGYLKRQLQSKEIISAIEQGADVPLPEPVKKNYLLPGVIWTLLGIVMALGMGLSIPDDPDIPTGVWVWGLLPCAVGAGYLVAYFMQQKEESDKPDVIE